MEFPVLLIGIGNPLRGDDGFGPAVIERLHSSGLPEGVTLLSLHQLAPEIVEDILAVDRVVFIDARLPESGAGEGILFEPVNAGNPGRDTLTHECPPSAVLHLARLLHGRAPEAWALSAPAADLSPGEGLSPACQEHAAAAVKVLLEWLAGEGDAGRPL